MSSLNGIKVKVGDVVYDILKGAGRVIDDGGGVLNITVDFGPTGGTMRFGQDGTFQGHQRLYWKPPYILQPRGPNDIPYEQTTALLAMIYDFLVSYETKEKNRC